MQRVGGERRRAPEEGNGSINCLSVSTKLALGKYSPLQIFELWNLPRVL